MAAVSEWQWIDRLAAAGRSLAYVTVTAILLVAASWPFGPSTPVGDDAATAGAVWVLLAAFCYAALTALTLAECAGRLRRRQATVSAEWTIHCIAQLSVLSVCGAVFFRGNGSRVAMLGLDTMIAAVTTVALLAAVLELVGRLSIPTDACDRGMFRMLRWNVASPARGMVLATTTLAVSLVLAATLVYCEYGGLM
jgi:hypothetical protein